MKNAVTKATLTPARKRLLEMMQEINHGRIGGLKVHNGQPVFDPPPTVVRLFLFSKNNGPNTCRGNDSFVLKKKMAELFEIFDREQFLLIKELIIENGLPVRMIVADMARD